VLDVGCGAGARGAAQKNLVPGSCVLGVERDPKLAARAQNVLDQVFTIEITTDDPPLEAGSLDCVLFNDSIRSLPDPAAVLRRLRRFLAPGGTILGTIANAQHHAMLTALATGDFQHAVANQADGLGSRFFSAPMIQKLLLDAGYEPTIVDRVRVSCPPQLLAAAQPLFDHYGLHRGRMAGYLSTAHYIVKGKPIDDSPVIMQDGRAAEQDDIPLSIVACVSDDTILEANLLASPCLKDGKPHEVILARRCTSAAEGLNFGLEQARNPLVVLTHQDVYLPRGWPARLARAYREADRRYGPIGVAGVYGVVMAESGPRRVGHVVDRDFLRDEDTPLPTPVATLDELLLIVPRGSLLRFEPSLGFHFYGADLCLAARQQGLAAVALGALCFHNSRHVDLPDAFSASAKVFAQKWAAQLPMATPCALLDRTGALRAF
jgi:hypothetical protein